MLPLMIDTFVQEGSNLFLHDVKFNIRYNAVALPCRDERGKKENWISATKKSLLIFYLK